ncbi:MAG TPA: hypothetical protein VFK05_01655 [Polyangiaceae bacterium]|nr:hypothetical protein [Polyangiaceae bacterium]
MSPAPRRSFVLLAAAFAFVVLAVCALRTHATYLEYYGDGPPYYGRTTNMDKWESPMFDLALSNALGLSLIALAFYLALYAARRRAGSKG